MDSRIMTRGRSAIGLMTVAGVAYVGWSALRRKEDDLTGQVVLITGGSRGLGLLLAKEFARIGCRIAICARDDLELQSARAGLEEVGASVLTVRCDVVDRLGVEAMIAEVTERFGRVDVLVNNAGIVQVGPFESMTIGDFERAMNVMYWGSLYTTLAVLPQMIERGGGRIVNITSIGGKVAVPHLLPYDAAKFALVALSEGLRSELKKTGVYVTTIVPGLMRTGSPVNALFKGDAEKEFTWFALSSATPITAMSAGRAARRIVKATRRREAEVSLSWTATMLRVANGLFPGAMSEVMGLVNRILPDGVGTETYAGMHLSTRTVPSLFTSFMNRAARRNNEFAGRQLPVKRHAEKVGLTMSDQGWRMGS